MISDRKPKPLRKCLHIWKVLVFIFYQRWKSITDTAHTAWKYTDMRYRSYLGMKKRAKPVFVIVHENAWSDWLSVKAVFSLKWTFDSRWATRQEQQAVGGNGLWGCHGNESFATQTVPGILPQNHCRPYSDPLPLPFHSSWGPAFKLTGPELFEPLPSHPPMLLLLRPLFTQSHAPGFTDNSARTSVWRKTGKSVYLTRHTSPWTARQQPTT